MADVYAACVGRFYEDLAERLVEGAQRVFEEAGATRRGARRARAPSSCRWPRSTAPTPGRYAGVACLGAVIRGETDHYDFVCAEAASGIARVSLDTGVPCAFGVLTVENMEQALARSGGGKRHQGEDAARAVLRMAALRRELGAAVINLYSDTQTRPTDGDARRRSRPPRWATSSAAPTPPRTGCRSAWPSCSARRRRSSFRAERCATRSRFRLHARPGGDELILDRSAAPDHRRGRRAGRNAQADDQRARRRRRACSARAGRGGDPAGRPLPAALARGVRGADDQHGRRARVAARAGRTRCSTWHASTACARTWTARG